MVDWESLGLAIARKTWGGKKRAAFYRRFAVYIENGIPPREALVRLHRQLDLRGVSAWDGDRQAYQEFATRISNGATLAQALEGWAPASERAIIQAGESSGQLPESLRSVLEGRGMISQLLGRIFFVSLEPLITGMVLLYLLHVIGSSLLPPMEALAPPRTWPLMAWIMIPLGDIGTSIWTLIGMIFMAFSMVGVFFSFSRWSGHGRRFVESIPPWSAYRKIQGAQWMMGFSRLLHAGVPEVEALELQAKFSPRWLQDRLVDAARRMRNGRSLGQALIEGGFQFPDRIVADDIAAFSGANDFSGLLGRLGKEWMKETETQLLGLAALWGIFITIAVNGVFLLAVFGMYQMQNVIMSAVHVG